MEEEDDSMMNNNVPDLSNAEDEASKDTQESPAEVPQSAVTKMRKMRTLMARQKKTWMRTMRRKMMTLRKNPRWILMHQRMTSTLWLKLTWMNQRQRKVTKNVILLRLRIWSSLKSFHQKRTYPQCRYLVQN